MRDAAYKAALLALRDRLSPKAVEHSERVARTAAELADLYAVDRESALVAGLLHDWDREVGDEGLIAAARSEGIEPSEADLALPYLLHARTGARGVARRFPDFGADVIQAIESHTVGAGEMEDLGRVLYVADMIEPGRVFPGVEELRGLVGMVTLDQLYSRCYQLTLINLVQRKRPLHPDTVHAWNALVAEEAR